MFFIEIFVSGEHIFVNFQTFSQSVSKKSYFNKK